MQKHYKSNRAITCKPIGRPKIRMPKTKLDLTFHDSIFQLAAQDQSPREAGSVVRFGGFGRSAAALMRKKALVGSIAALLVLAVTLSFCMTNYALAYEVVIDGQKVGVVSEKEAFIETYTQVNDELQQYEDTEDVALSEPEFALVIVPLSDTTPEEELKQNLLSSVDTMVASWVITVDGKALAGLPSRELCDDALLMLRAGYGIAPEDEVAYATSVDIAEGAVPVTMFVQTPEEAQELLKATETEEIVYTVQDGDVFSVIAEQNSMTVDALHGLNPEVDVDHIKAGMTLKLNRPETLLKMLTTRREQREEEIPFEVETVKDETKLKGTQETARNGVAGKALVTVEGHYVNGARVSETLVSRETIAEPVNKVVKIGVKEPPKTVATGSFLRPVGGTVSSSFGSRWGRRHNGVDIAASMGTAVKAADGGRVTYASWMSGYGKLIIVDHENGYCTYYAHLSAINVSVGQRVAKGAAIGKVGNTGNSTGPHLHFEVRKNNTPQNPMNYIG